MCGYMRLCQGIKEAGNVKDDPGMGQKFGAKLENWAGLVKDSHIRTHSEVAF